MSLVAAATAVVGVATRGDGSKTPSALATPAPVTLVVPSASRWSDDPSAAQYEDALDSARTADGVGTQMVQIDLKKKGLSGLSRRDRKRIGTSGLVLLAGQFVAARFVHEFAHDRDTRFVVVDPDPINGALYDAVSSNKNTSDVFFVEGPGAYLAGFLSALMAKRKSAGKRPVVVSEILVNRDVSANVADTFKKGAKDAVRRITVRRKYVGEFSPRSRCRRIADDQVEHGSLVVFADAGACSADALDAVKTLGAWGVEGDQDPLEAPGGPRLIGYTVKNVRQAVGYAVRHYVGHTLPRRKHNEIGIQNNGAVDFVMTDLVPSEIRVRVEERKELKWPRWAALGKS